MKTMRLCLVLLLWASAARAQSPENVLLVLNEASPISLEVGKYYAQKRGIPEANVLRVRTVPEEEISRADFARQIEGPIGAWINRNSAQDRILYIVLTKGFPLRVQGTSGQQGTIASVDSELTTLYARLAGVQVALPGALNNPYFLGTAPLARAIQFTHEKFSIYLVSRLDGYTSADIRGLIDRGFAPRKEGKILMDQKGAGTDKGDDWLQGAADWMAANGFKDRIVLAPGATVLKDQTGVLGYYSWGSNDPAIKIRHFNLGFVPGALAAMYVSSDGRTFSEPPVDWNIGPWEDKAAFFGGSPQSLIADLIRDGATGVAGHVAEPYLEYTIRPNILFPAYLSGFNLIESFYLAMPALSWQTVVIGDPLCAPFRAKSLEAQAIDKGIDPETEFPHYFSQLRLRSVAASPVRLGVVEQDTTKLMMKAEVRLAKQDLAGARQALEQATARDARLGNAHFLLAILYEQAGEYDKAEERYRKVLEITPGNPIALNNLAYSLAVRRNAVKEALELAERANALAKGNPSIMDTLAWVYHLSGSNDKALELLQSATKLTPDNAEMHMHLAVVLADLGQLAPAAAELARALELDPKLESTPEVKALRPKLKK